MEFLYGWFEKFASMTWVTIAALAAALIGAGAALIKRDKAKPVLIATGIVEALIFAAALILFAVKGGETTGFEDVDLSAAVMALIIGGLVIFMAICMIVSGRKQKWSARDIALAAMCVAMSFILSCIKLYSMPQGGSITPASFLPMVIYIAAFGPGRGLVLGCAYGLLQLIQGAYVVHPVQLLVDYPMAYGAMALGGLVRYIKMPRWLKLPSAVVLGYLGRYAMAVLSGTVFFAEYAGGQNAFVYSAVYNLSYLGFDCLVCAIVAFLPAFARLTDSVRKGSLGA